MPKAMLTIQLPLTFEGFLIPETVENLTLTVLKPHIKPNFTSSTCKIQFTDLEEIHAYIEVIANNDYDH